MMDEKPTISIITATYNSSKHIPNLVASLEAQSDRSFEWIIVDNESTDNTLKELDGSKINTKVICEKDFGIYDAINKGIRAAQSEYYLIVGSDDTLYANCIADLREAASTYDVDILTGWVIKDGKVIKPNKKSKLIHKQRSFISTHSVGTIIRTSLHNDLGLYSNKYPIAADQLFLLTAEAKKVKIAEIKKILGEFSKEGVSSSDIAGTLCESFRIQLKFHNTYLVFLIFLLKLLKNIRKL